MKYIIPFSLVFALLVSTFVVSPSFSASTVSGEIKNTPKILTAPKVQYLTDARGYCYTLIKNKKNGKMVKRLALKKFCKINNTTK